MRLFTTEATPPENSLICIGIISPIKMNGIGPSPIAKNMMYMSVLASATDAAAAAPLLSVVNTMRIYRRFWEDFIKQKNTHTKLQ